MAATAPTEVVRPAGNTCCSDQPPASNDVESCSAPLRGLAIRCQKRAVLFPRRHGLPTCESCAFGALGGRQQRARFAHLGLRTASRLWRSLPCFRSRGRRSALVTRLPPREARCRWVGAEGHPRQQRPFLARPAPADHEPCPSFLHRSPATHRPRHGTALSCHETSLKWSPLQPSVETLRYWDLQPVSDADERRSRVDEDVDQVRARSRPFGLGAREGGAGEPSPAEASGAVLAQCVSRARVRRSVRESPAAPFLRGRARSSRRR